MNQNVYVLTTIFNPFNFRSRNDLYPKFAKHMRESGAHLFTVEAAFGDQGFRFTSADDPMALQVRTDQVFFHKERMLNLGLKKLEHVQPDAKNIGWFDADITFLDPDWAAKAAHALRMYRVIQPFGEAINLNAGDEYQWNGPSSMRAFLDKRGYHQKPPLPIIQTFKGHPGICWMARRKTLMPWGAFMIGASHRPIRSCRMLGREMFLPSCPVRLRRGCAGTCWTGRGNRAPQYRGT